MSQQQNADYVKEFKTGDSVSLKEKVKGKRKKILESTISEYNFPKLRCEQIEYRIQFF